jgi:hypothetical protein
MKALIGFTSRGNPKQDMRCALLMSVEEREQRRLITGRNITYASFEYDMLPKPVPMIERAWPEAPQPVSASYWIEQHNMFTATVHNMYRTEVPVAPTHLGVRMLKAGTLRFGTEALKKAAQARVRELMAARALARRSEWHALARIAA